MIEVVDLNKSFGDLHVLKDINISVEKGEKVVVVGPSGSGKSTLLHILGGVDVPSAGKVYIDNVDVYEQDETNLAIFRRRQIGLIYQFYNLIPVLTAKENILLPFRLDGQQPDMAYFNEIVRSFDIADRQDHLPNQLSGGQQQRVSIARALLTKPAIVLADEPTGNLDSVTSMEVVGLLKSCAARFHQTTLIVTHQEEVAQMADRVIRMSDGKIYTRDCNDC